MSYYAIGIGGTGAKCLESLIHLCAAGLMPDNENLYVLFVDPDGANGSLGRAGMLLECYKNCKINKAEGTDFLKTSITAAQPKVWSPLSKGVNKLKDFVGYSNLSNEYRHLFDVLFTPDERNTNLEKGFRGHPSIGSAVMASAISLDDVEPWLTIQDRINKDANGGKRSKVMLFGSIFGGTGASGFPTIARILKSQGKEKQDKYPCDLGGVLMLPYFSFDRVQGNDENEMHADSRDFLLNTQGALLYYKQQRYEEKFDTIYLLGSDDLRKMRVAKLGGNEQENDPHWTEFYGALAAINFFSGKNAGKQPYHLVARQSAGRLNWGDLPHDNDELKQKIFQFTRFSFAFLSTYYPMLKDISLNKKEYRAPWYVNFFHYKNISLNDSLNNEMEEVKDYCEKFLLWLANVEFSVTGTRLEGGLENLIDFSSFADVVSADKGDEIKLRNRFALNGFNNFLLPRMEENDAGLADLWEKMCNLKPKGEGSEDAWTFINELYRQCGNLKR